MKVIEYKYFIGDRVKIKDLGISGVVISVWSGRRGNETQVRFCANGKYEEVYFFDSELELDEKTP